MNIADIASSVLDKFAKHYGKKTLRKQGTAPELPKVQPTVMKNPNGGKKFNSGFAKLEVMPSYTSSNKYSIAGHGMKHWIEGVHDPITVSAMWLDCMDGKGIVTVSADCIGLTGYEVEQIRNSLSDFCKESGCVSINICCTHNHAGYDTVGYWGNLPKTGKDPEYMKKLMDSIKQVCIDAYKNRTEGTLYLGTIHVPDAQYDKREPVVLHDTFTRFRFVPDNGNKETWLLNYAAHPNTLGGKNRNVSADYPYYMRETIYKEKDVNILYGIGAIGAVDPGMYSEDLPERTALMGEALGKASLAIDNDEALDSEITVLQHSPISNSVLSLMAILKVVSSKKVACDKGGLGLALVTEMTYLKIGKQQILLLPGEMFPELAYGGYSSAETSATGKGPEINPTPLVEIANDPDLLIFGVTNDMTGYIVPPNDFVLNETQPYLSNGKDRFGRGHYHETNSLGLLTSETIANVFADIMKRV